ncbi:MAG: A/G-specific adenine glycosylase, partial [Bdellovibrionota bacterium]
MAKQSFPEKVMRTCRWFEKRARVLPWRDDPTPYRVWVSEIMLQQTQVSAVVPFFDRFLARFPDVSFLAAAKQEAVLTAWSGLGYYARARNLQKAAQTVVRDRGGALPESREGWLQLPGIGPYTAGAIASIAQGQPEAIVDGNVERVLSRVLGLQRGVRALKSTRTFRDQIWKASGEWVRAAHDRKGSPSVANQALMELGATVCAPVSPRCQDCPIGRAGCRAAASGKHEF